MWSRYLFLKRDNIIVSETPIGALLEVYTTLRATVRPAWAGVSTGGPGQDWDLEI